MAITYHTGERGVPGFSIYTTGSDGITRGTVIPAYVPVDATGAVITGSGGAATIADGADVAEGATTDAAVASAGNGSLVALAKGTQTLSRNQVQILAAQSFTRPADTTAYTGSTSTVPGDLVANSTTAGSVTPLTFTPTAISGATAEGYITFIELQITAAVSTTLRAHIIQTTAPTVTNGDNGTIALSNYTVDTYLGFVDVVMTPSAAGGAMGGDDSLLIPYSTASNIYVLLETIIAWTPTSAGTVRCALKFSRTK